MPRRRLAVVYPLLDRYNDGAGARAIPDTGKITADMIRTEWSHTGTFRLSADGASFIKKSPSTNIKYSDFRGKSAASGATGTVNPCPAGGPGNLSMTGTWMSVGDCSGSANSGSSCGGHSCRYSGQKVQSQYYGGVKLYCQTSCSENSSSKLNASCGIVGLGVELYPGTWQANYSYQVACETTQKVYGARQTNSSMEIWLGPSKTSMGSAASPTKRHNVKAICGIDQCIGQKDTGNSNVRFTVSAGNQYPSMYFWVQSSDYRSSQDFVTLTSLTQV